MTVRLVLQFPFTAARLHPPPPHTHTHKPHWPSLGDEGPPCAEAGLGCLRPLSLSLRLRGGRRRPTWSREQGGKVAISASRSKSLWKRQNSSNDITVTPNNYYTHNIAVHTCSNLSKPPPRFSTLRQYFYYPLRFGPGVKHQFTYLLTP